MGETNHKSTIRYARTAVTGAENAGRTDSYRRAEAMGIDMEQEWQAVHDMRTRHEHRQLDGQRRPVGEPFEVDGEEILYPGDPSAPGYLIWNCRCRLRGIVDGLGPMARKYRSLEDIDGMSYEEWKASKVEKPHNITKQEEIAETMRRKYIREDYGGGNRSKRNETFSDRMLHTTEDPMREMIGDAFQSHPKEIQELLDDFKHMGVSVEYRKNAMGYEPQPLPGKPGKVVMDPDASYSAWLHEKQHVKDDEKTGWNGFRNFADPNIAAEFESRAYDVEIDFAKGLGYNEIIERLERLKAERIREVLGNEAD